MNNKNTNENFVIVRPLSLPRSARHGSRFSSAARDLRGPGLRAYFWHAPKVGKNALKPGGLRIPHFLISLRPRHSLVLSKLTAVRFVPLLLLF